MSTKSFIFTVLALLGFSSSCLSEVTLISDYNCKEPAFSEVELTNIVQQERATNPAFPARVENSELSIVRVRCHYVYWETPEKVRRSFSVTINTFGRIVKYHRLHELKRNRSCPQPEHSIEDIAEFLRLARLRYSDLPEEREEMETIMVNSQCLYFYFEESMLEGNVFLYAYIFDYDGELFSFEVETDEGLRARGYLN